MTEYKIWDSEQMKDLFNKDKHSISSASHKLRVDPVGEIIQEPIKIMKDYLMLKFELGDWHGVADAANDIREMLAKEKK